MAKDRVQDGEYQKSVLNNGMKVITEYIPYVRSVSIGFCIDGGSRIEPVSLNGVTHFIEHMLFKGTKKRSAIDIAIQIDSIGGHLDAFTSREYTCFFVNALDENLSVAMALLADILLNPTFPVDEMERERGVILEEISSIEETPDEYIHDLLTRKFWGDHPLGRPIIGIKSTLDAITRDELKRYYHETYQPQRLILTGAGNLKHEQILEMVRDVIPVPEHPFTLPPQPLPAIKHNISSLEKDLEQVHICIATAGLPQTDKDRYAGYLLNVILGGGISSRLFQSIREERGLAYTIFSYWSSYKDTGMLLVYAGTKRQSTNEVIDLVLEEFRKMKKDYVTQEELKRAKNQLKGHIMLGLESTINRMSKLAKQEMYFGRAFTLNETLSAIDRVTRKEILNLAERIMDKRYLNLASIGSLKGLSLARRNLAC